MKQAIYVVLGPGGSPVWVAIKKILESYPATGLTLVQDGRVGFDTYVSLWADTHGVPEALCQHPELVIDILTGLLRIGYEVCAEVVSPGYDERALAKRLEQKGIRVTVTEVE